MTNSEFEDVRPKRNHTKGKNKGNGDPFLRKRKANYKKHKQEEYEEYEEYNEDYMDEDDEISQ